MYTLLLHKGFSFCASDFFPSDEYCCYPCIFTRSCRKVAYFSCLVMRQVLCPWSLGVGFSQHPWSSSINPGSGTQAGFVRLPQVALAKSDSLCSESWAQVFLAPSRVMAESHRLSIKHRMGVGLPVPPSAVDNFCFLSVNGLRQMGFLLHTHW